MPDLHIVYNPAIVLNENCHINSKRPRYYRSLGGIHLFISIWNFAVYKSYDEMPLLLLWHSCLSSPRALKHFLFSILFYHKTVYHHLAQVFIIILHCTRTWKRSHTAHTTYFALLLVLLLHFARAFCPRTAFWASPRHAVSKLLLEAESLWHDWFDWLCRAFYRKFLLRLRAVWCFIDTMNSLPLTI